METWRLAFMFDAAGGDLAALEAGLVGRTAELRRRAEGADVRLGVADKDPRLLGGAGADYDLSSWRTVDAAVEVTVPAAAAAPGLSDVASALFEVIARLAAPGSIEVTTGPIFPMVPQRDGECFLSLAFRRDLGITRRQFFDWWRYQHSQIAIPVLGPGLLAYDQVHVDTEASDAVAEACGVEHADYDAYDNLTWADVPSYLASISDLVGMARIMEDEVGHIDNGTRRHAIMRRLG
jgi:hypothetical protein